jgi:restriction system protein
MPIPDYQSLMRPVLATAAAETNGVWKKDLVTRIAAHFKLTDAEREEQLASGENTLANRIGWARFYLLRAGLLTSPQRGLVQATEDGRKALQAYPQRIDNTVLKTYPSFAAFINGAKNDQAGASATPETAAQTPEERLRTAHDEVQVALKSQLLDRVREGSPAFFERLVVDLLKAMGYGGALGAGRVLGRSGDNGVDGVIDQDALGLDRIYIQAKRYGPASKISADEIRNFFGALDLHKASKGLYVTTSSFTSQATDTAEKLGKRIVLLDGAGLADMMIRFNVGTRVERTFHLCRMDEDFFLEETA